MLNSLADFAKSACGIHVRRVQLIFSKALGLNASQGNPAMCLSIYLVDAHLRH